MASYRPNINAACHCSQCLNSLRVLGPTVGGVHGSGRYYLHVCAYIYLLPPFLKTDHISPTGSVIHVIGTTHLERVSSRIPQLQILVLHLHCLLCHPLSLSHQLVRQAPWNGFQNYVYTPPTAKDWQILSVKTVPANPAASNSMVVAIGSEGTGLQTSNPSIYLLFLALNRRQTFHSRNFQSTLRSRLTTLLRSYDRETQCFGCVKNALLGQLRNNKQPLVKQSWRLKKMWNTKRPLLSLCVASRQVVPSHQPHLFPTHIPCQQPLQPPLPWQDCQLRE